MPYYPPIQQEQYPATDETQCVEIIIPAGDEFKALLAGMIVECSNAMNYADPESVEADGLAAIWDEAYSQIDWNGCEPVVDASVQGSVALWHRLSVVTTGGALVTTVSEVTQPFAHFCSQSPAANGDDFYQYAWLAAGDYEIKALGVRIANSGQFRVIMQYQADLSTVTALPTTDFHGATLYNFLVSSTFTLTQSGLYKVFGQVPGKNAASSGYTVRLTMMQITRTA